jgi:choline dehydrogenase
MAPLLSIAFLATFLLSAQALAAASVDNKTYEYIVVGSGPGGGPIASNLARAGHSVLLIEAGDDQTENVSRTTQMRDYTC